MNIVLKRLSAAAIVAATITAAAAPVLADYADFSGNWAVNGHIIGGGAYLLVMPVCALQQSGAQISGFCKGSNGEGPAEGLANGFQLRFQWRAASDQPDGHRRRRLLHRRLGRRRRGARSLDVDGLARGRRRFHRDADVTSRGARLCSRGAIRGG